MSEQNLTKAERKLRRREEKQTARATAARREGRMKMWRYAGALLGLAALASLAFYLGSTDKQPSESGSVVAVSEDDWVKGAPSSPEAASSQGEPAILIEYGDFQCPACANFHPIVKAISEELGAELRVVYRHFPLRQAHPQAQLAAQAAEAAGEQGRFWQMHDLLFERQSDWSNQGDARQKFLDYARELALEEGRFAEDLDRSETEAKVEADYRSGVAARVNSTPTFFLNGEKLQVQTIDDFETRIREAAIQ